MCLLDQRRASDIVCAYHLTTVTRRHRRKPSTVGACSGQALGVGRRLCRPCFHRKYRWGQYSVPQYVPTDCQMSVRAKSD